MPSMTSELPFNERDQDDDGKDDPLNRQTKILAAAGSNSKSWLER